MCDFCFQIYHIVRLTLSVSFGKIQEFSEREFLPLNRGEVEHGSEEI